MAAGDEPDTEPAALSQLPPVPGASDTKYEAGVELERAIVWSGGLEVSNCWTVNCALTGEGEMGPVEAAGAETEMERLLLPARWHASVIANVNGNVPPVVGTPAIA